MKKQYHFNTNAAKRLLAVCLCTAMAGTAAIPALAAETVEKSASSETYTYYFLAPDTFFDTNVGAPNSDVGVTMEQAPEIGDNVFKIEGVSPDTSTIIFNAFTDVEYPVSPQIAVWAHQTCNINTEGYWLLCRGMPL